MAYTKKQKSTTKDLAYKVVTDRMVSLIEKALDDGSTLAPWHKPWNSTSGVPRNIKTKKAYRGVNVLMLGIAGFNSPYWGSWKQIEAKGGKVKPEETKNYTYATFFKWMDIPKDKKDPNSDTINIPFLRYFKVYNLEQTEGIEMPSDDTLVEEVNPIDECEAILNAMKDGCIVKHGGSRAYYVPSRDHIQMPELKNFDSAEDYYSTRFHETVHSTGHESRLNRPSITDATYFGSTNYSKEELVAEMGAAFLCGIVGIDNGTAENSASYLKNWLSKLKNDPKLLVQAAGLAQKAVDYVLGTTFDN